MGNSAIICDTERTLEARGISKICHTGEVTVRALDSVDFALYRGEIVVLLGASGSGKSTLLNIVGGLDSPSEGHVFFKQEELTEFDDPALTAYRRDHVGFEFRLYNLIPSLTVKENVALITETAPIPSRRKRRLLS